MLLLTSPWMPFYMIFYDEVLYMEAFVHDKSLENGCSDAVPSVPSLPHCTLYFCNVIVEREPTQCPLNL